MPDSSPRFSVIMPCYNRRKLIRAAVMSVLDQTFTDFELIVVDDGSTDDTLDVLADITDARLSLHQQRNSGPGAARNKGIGIAQGQYVAFLDSDDLYLPWTLQNYDQALKQNKDPSLLICEAKDFHHDAQMNSVVQKLWKFNVMKTICKLLIRTFGLAQVLSRSNGRWCLLQVGLIMRRSIKKIATCGYAWELRRDLLPLHHRSVLVDVGMNKMFHMK